MRKNALTLMILFSMIHLYGAANTLDQIIKNRIDDEVFTTQNDRIYTIKSTSTFYTERLYKAAWNNTQYTTELLASITNADKEGLIPSDYHLESIKRLLDQQKMLTLEQRADLEFLCTDAFLLYSSHLLSGKINPETIDSDWHVTRREGNPLHVLKQAIDSTGIKASFSAILPKHAVYKSLRSALSRYRKMEKAGGWKTIPEGEALKIGMNTERVKWLKDRLITSEDLAISNYGNAMIFDENLATAVKKYQRRNGLTDDGVVGAGTLASLNIPVGERIEQIRVNMERWRWLPQEYGSYYMKVNIVNFKLEIFKEGIRDKTHNVIVGKAARRTPVLSSKLNHLILNPTWTVPPTILREDIIPSVRKNVGYLKTKNLQVLDSKGNVLDPYKINWNGNVMGYTYRQPAGVDNALGAVKFMFPNKYNVYIHDTPSKDLFSQTERSFSSGCIRVEHPLDLAHYLINDETKWPKERIDNVVKSKVTTSVSLKNKPDVYVLYWTAWTDKDDIIQFRKDIYQRDERLLNALNERPSL